MSEHKQTMIIQAVKISAIKIPKGRTIRSEAHVKALAESMAVVGLLEPIGVDRAGVLKYGMNRLKAAEMLGWEKIHAVQVTVEGLEAELACIDENLLQPERTALERGQLTAARKAVYEKLHPDAPTGAGRPSKTMPRSSAPFVTDTAEKSGQSERSVQEDIQVGTIDEEAAEIIADTPIADSKTQLLELARETPAKQRKAAKKIKEGKAKSVGEATGKKAKKPRPTTATRDPETDEAKKEIIRLSEENDKLREKVKLLQTDDAKAALAKERDRYERLSGRLAGAMTTANEAQKQATYYGDILKKVAKRLDVEKYSEIVSALNEALQ